MEFFLYSLIKILYNTFSNYDDIRFKIFDVLIRVYGTPTCYFSNRSM
jgi:hypothetical protein